MQNPWNMVFGAWLVAIAMSLPAAGATFEDAVAWWRMADLTDSNGPAYSNLSTYPATGWSVGHAEAIPGHGSNGYYATTDTAASFYVPQVHGVDSEFDPMLTQGMTAFVRFRFDSLADAWMSPLIRRDPPSHKVWVLQVHGGRNEVMFAVSSDGSAEQRVHLVDFTPQVDRWYDMVGVWRPDSSASDGSPMACSA